MHDRLDRHPGKEAPFPKNTLRFLGTVTLASCVVVTSIIAANNRAQLPKAPSETAHSQTIVLVCVGNGQNPHASVTEPPLLVGTQPMGSEINFYINCANGGDYSLYTRTLVSSGTSARTTNEGAIQTGICTAADGHSTDGLPTVTETPTAGGANISISCKSGFTPAGVGTHFPDDGAEGIGSLPPAQSANEVKPNLQAAQAA